MPDTSKLELALRNASAAADAGDPQAANDARALALEIRRLRGSPKPAAATRSPGQEEAELQRLVPGVSTNPADGQSFATNAAQGAGKALVDSYDGLKQTAVEGLQSFLRLGDMASRVATGKESAGGKAARGIDPLAQFLRMQQDERSKRDAPLMDTWGGNSGYAGSVLTQIVGPGAVLKGASVVPQLARAAPALSAASSAFLPTSVAGATAQGAMLGAVQPVGVDDSRGKNTVTGAGLGLGGSLIPRALGAAYRAVAAPIRQVTAKGVAERTAAVLREEAEDIASLARPAPSAVPGVQRTLAEESLDPGIASLEQVASGSQKGLDQLQRQNNAARVRALRAIGGDEADIAAAEVARDAAAIPALQRVIATAQDGAVDTSPVIASIAGMEKRYTGNPAMQAALKKLRDQVEASNGNMAYLENARQYAGNLISGTADGTMVKLPQLIGAKDELTQAMRQASPDFGDYLDKFRDMSKPINRMELGQQLAGKKSGSAVIDAVTGEQVLTPAAFSNQARNLDAAAQQATGFGRAKAADILTPADIATVGAIQDDLQRRAFASTARRTTGSPTQGLTAVQKRIESQLASKVPLVGAALEELNRVGQARLSESLAMVLANPQAARELLARVPANDRRVLEAAISRAGGSVGAMSVTAKE